MMMPRDTHTDALSAPALVSPKWLEQQNLGLLVQGLSWVIVGAMQALVITLYGMVSCPSHALCWVD